MADVVICNLPKMEGFFLPPSPAILKGGCNYVGITSTVLDFNLAFIDECKALNINYANRIVGITKDSLPDEELCILVNTLVVEWSKQILLHSPKLIAISVFSYLGQYFTKQLCSILKTISPNTNIILGGSGITNSISEGPEFAIQLKAANIIDHYIAGDAEIAWPTFLINFFSINFKKDITDGNHLNILYAPDYSDYDIPRYEKYRTTTGQLWLPVTGSKGCVRNCTFCEVPSRWKFTQRGAKQIVEEIAAIVKLADNVRVQFTDSLVNGNLKEFDGLLTKLIELQHTEPHTFGWAGQFICRPNKVDNWKKIAASGCQMLEIGIETGSDTLRFEMDKKFKNEDLLYTLQMLAQHNIKCVLLMFCGYPTETESQFEETLAFFKAIRSYSATIRAVQLNFSFCVFKDTPLYNNREAIRLQTTDDPAQWHCATNPTLDFKERIRRRLLTQELLEQLGFNFASGTKEALTELVPNYIRFRGGKEYTFDQMAEEALGRATTITHRY